MICLHIWNETIPYQTQLSYTHCSNFKPKRYLTHTCLYLSTSKSNELCLQLQQRLAWIDHSITRVLHSNSIFLLKKIIQVWRDIVRRPSHCSDESILPLRSRSNLSNIAWKIQWNITILIYWVILFTYK